MLAPCRDYYARRATRFAVDRYYAGRAETITSNTVDTYSLRRYAARRAAMLMPPRDAPL